MTEEIISPDLLLIGYNKYVAMIAKQAIWRNKYRQEESAKKEEYEKHKAWVAKNKNDKTVVEYNEYKKNINENQRRRYRKRKAKLEEVEKNLAIEKEKENSDSLGEN